MASGAMSTASTKFNWADDAIEEAELAARASCPMTPPSSCEPSPALRPAAKVVAPATVVSVETASNENQQIETLVTEQGEVPATKKKIDPRYDVRVIDNICVPSSAEVDEKQAFAKVVACLVSSITPSPPVVSSDMVSIRRPAAQDPVAPSGLNPTAPAFQYPQPAIRAQPQKPFQPNSPEELAYWLTLHPRYGMPHQPHIETKPPMFVKI
ncbi:uncharacterized protein LY89DRAFT_676824 [Mollisia scopiformis]|uniref:Uncharacterized protein n=1 Tax=Mollisia scopiformis TaxID=149040 RepID=A0A132B955_MOLSC|nr:uncharacterized protein LY89DRAFT_676824 [Mollisia scopiformis]KUJ08404.1 hypothetical protein LY89DRAFT_676824 [Mollisia scopiformis]